MKTSFNDKIKEFFGKVKIVKNLARQMFVFSFVLGLIKSRKVHFCEIAQHLNEQTQDICWRSTDPGLLPAGCAGL